jgi:sodium/bile acid cotransporter 7
MDVGRPKTFIRTISSFLLWLLKDQWFVLALGLVILIASQVQVPASHQAVKETAVSYLTVGLIFFVTGCTLPTRVLIENYSRWKLHIFVQAGCFLVTSSLAFAVVSAAASNPHFMDPWLLIGLIMNGCLPTTIASNVVMTKQAHGNQALTVVQTTIGNFLAVFLSPILVRMYLTAGAWYTDVLPKGQAASIGSLYSRVFMQLGLTIYLPLVVGQVIRHFFPKQVNKVFVEWNFSKVGSFCLLTLVWQTFDRAFETRAFESVPGSNMIFICFISVTNWTLWLAVSFTSSLLWLGRKDTIAVCYCVPAKTLAMGVPLATLLYKNLPLVDEAKLQIPMVIFQAFQVLFSSLLTIPLRKWSDAEGAKVEQDENEPGYDDKREGGAEVGSTADHASSQKTVSTDGIESSSAAKDRETTRGLSQFAS